VDGGIRNGRDVTKALALGARAVMVGRPIVWALAAFGEDGVRGVVRRLTTDLERTMAFCGAASLDDLTRDLVTR